VGGGHREPTRKMGHNPAAHLLLGGEHKPTTA
jgi:hypothetical protein